MTITGLGQGEEFRGRFAGGLVAEKEPGLASENRILDRLVTIPSLLLEFITSFRDS
jgi:hypothetical protein